VTLLPGVGREQLRESLRQVHTDAYNLRGGSYGSGHALLTRYLAWASTAVRMLANQLRPADIDRLVLTRGYERLLASAGRLTGADSLPILNDLLNLELTQRVDDLDEAIKNLDEAIKRWSGREVIAVADTSLYIEHEHKLEELDLAPLLQIWEDPIRVFVPIIVVDELDGLKRSSDAHTRWRAGYTLAVFDRLFVNTASPARLRDEDFSGIGKGGLPRGEVTMELVFDPPGHVRLAINDDEIVDRALAIEPLTGRKVTLLTFDTGQASRARNAGLNAVKLLRPLGDEPPKSRGNRSPTRSATKQ
jgi:hypothetical protein